MYISFAVIALLLTNTAIVSAQEILEATREGDIGKVESLLKTDPGLVNETDDRNCTALHFACNGNFIDIIRLLLANGADITAKDVDGDTPLHWAAYAGHTGIATVLIERGAPVEALNKRSDAPIHYAARRGHIEIVVLLIENGADVNAQNHGGETPVLRASLGNHIGIARILIDAGADLEIKDSYGRTPLLLVARETGDVETAKFLISAGANFDVVDNYGGTPLLLSAWRGFRPLVNLLLDEGAKLPTEKGQVEEITSNAATKGLARLFGELATSGVDFMMENENGGSLLHSAAEGGSTEIVETLLGKGLGVNEQDRYGWTPLHYAAKKGRTDAARLLIDRGADIDKRTLAGYTPRGLAEEFDRGDVARLLEAKGSKAKPLEFPELRGKYLGQTPPDNDPALFAVDIVSSNRFEHGTVTFSPDGAEAFWGSSFFLGESGYTYGRLLTTRVEKSRWTAPEMAAFSGIQLGDSEPIFSPDGKKLYFLSRRPLEPGGNDTQLGIWVVEKQDDGWSEPRRIQGGPNKIGLYWQFSVADNGNIYFGSSDPGGFGRSDVYVSRPGDGVYLDAENLSAVVNGESSEGSPFVAPDESYLIITRGEHASSLGDMDLCISFRDENGTWATPINFPAPINSPSRDMCPHVSGDGRYLFFNSFRNGQADNYWVDAGIIDGLRSRR